MSKAYGSIPTSEHSVEMTVAADEEVSRITFVNNDGIERIDQPDDDKYDNNGLSELAGAAKKGGGRLAIKAGELIKKRVEKEKKKLTHSRFDKWSREEMAELIVNMNVVLRDFSRINDMTLMDLCDELFPYEVEMPKPPRTYKSLDLSTRIRTVLSIHCFQNKYVEYRSRGMGSENSNYVNIERFHEKDSAHQEAVDFDFSNASQDISSLLIDEEAGTKQTDKFKAIIAFLDHEWEPPSFETAEAFASFVNTRQGGAGGKKFNFYTVTTGRHCCLGGLGEQLDLWQEGLVSEFSMYGSGVSNYFKFLKWGIWLFAGLTIIFLPMLIININGPYTRSTTGLNVLSMTTVGNLQDTVANATVSVNIPGCANYGFENISCTLDAVTLGYLYCWLDIAGVIFALVATFWLIKFQRIEESTVEKTTISAADFTIVVKGLPSIPSDTPDWRLAGALELEEHFLGLLHRTVKQHRKVTSVRFAFDQHELITMCKERGDLMNKKAQLIHQHRYEATQIRRGEDGGHIFTLSNKEREAKVAKARKEFFEKVTAIEYKIKCINQALEKASLLPHKPIAAFVTFDDNLSPKLAINSYNLNYFTWWFMRPYLRLREKRLNVKRAPEPSTLIWENMQASWKDRTLRRIMTTVFALCTVLLSLFTTFGAKVLQNKATLSGGTSLCPSEFYSLSTSQQEAYVNANNAYLHCYCDQFSAFKQATESACKSYAKKAVEAQVLTYFASLIVVIVKVMLHVIVRWLADFELHHSDDTKARSIFMRLFVLEYVNTSFVFLVSDDNAVLQKIFGYTSVSTSEFSSSWFSSIGTTIILVQIQDIVVSKAIVMYDLFVLKFKQYMARTRKGYVLSQEELNKIYMGLEFEMPFRYAQLLSTIFVTFTFGIGIPLLYPIACATMLFAYFLDKFIFVSYSLTPERLNATLSHSVAQILPFALVIHLGMSIWVLSNNELFSNMTTTAVSSEYLKAEYVTSSKMYDRITRQQTFPLFVFLLLIGGIHMVLLFSKQIISMLHKCRRAIFGSKKSQRVAEKALDYASHHESLVTYTRAVQRNLIKGLNNYNLLQNTKYKEMFGLSWQFPVEDCDITDIRFSSSDIDVQMQGGKEAGLQPNDSPKSFDPALFNEPFDGASATPHGSSPAPMQRRTSAMMRAAGGVRLDPMRDANAVYQYETREGTDGIMGTEEYMEQFNDRMSTGAQSTGRHTLAEDNPAISSMAARRAEMAKKRSMGGRGHGL